MRDGPDDDDELCPEASFGGTALGGGVVDGVELDDWELELEGDVELGVCAYNALTIHNAVAVNSTGNLFMRHLCG